MRPRLSLVNSPEPEGHIVVHNARFSVRVLPLQRRSFLPHLSTTPGSSWSPFRTTFFPRLLFADPPIRLLNHEFGIRTHYNCQHNWSSGHRMGHFVSVGP